MRYRNYSSRMDYIKQRKDELSDLYDDDFKGYSHEVEKTKKEEPNEKAKKQQGVWKLLGKMIGKVPK